MEQQNKMGTAKMGPLMFSMALPAMISMIINALYNIVDSIFVAKYSQDALAAVSLVYPIQMLVVAIGVGTGVGVNSLIARRLGEKRQEEAAARAKQLREEREAKKAAEEAAKAAAEAGADAAETAVQMAAAPAETAAAGSVITALTPEKAAPAALDETPAAAPENTAEKDVPDTPKND